MPLAAITFDIGQTLLELDVDYLVRRLAERTVRATASSLGASMPGAFAVYNQRIAASQGQGSHPWRAFMHALLTASDLDARDRIDELTEWLWLEQPRNNLWKRPIAGMAELAAAAQRAGIATAIISNAEGRSRELLTETAMVHAFPVIADSALVGHEKPAAAIFHWTLRQLGLPQDTPGESLVHIGDAWAADITGARGVGWRAIWFGAAAVPVDDTMVGVARDAREVAAILASLDSRLATA